MKNFVMGLIVGVGLTTVVFINFSSRYELKECAGNLFRIDKWSGQSHFFIPAKPMTYWEKINGTKPTIAWDDQNKKPLVLTDEEMKKLPDASK